MSEVHGQKLMVDVCLVTWNGAEFVRGCLESLARQTFPHYTLTVLDNGSTDQTLSLVREWAEHHPVTIQTSENNRGFSAAHNSLLRQGSAPYVLVLNQDTDLAPNYLEALVTALEVTPQVASASGLLLRLNHSPQELGRTHLIDAAGLKIYPTHRVVEWRRGDYLDTNDGKTKEVFGVPATAALYRRTALEAVSITRGEHREYFDETFVSYKEDVDLAYRLVLGGWSSVCVWGAIAYHVRGLRGDDSVGPVGGLSTVRHRQQKRAVLNEQSYRNHLFLLFGDLFFPVTSYPWRVTFIYEMGKFVVILVTEPRTLRAWKDVWKNRHLVRAKRQEIKKRGLHFDRLLYWLTV